MSELLKGRVHNFPAWQTKQNVKHHPAHVEQTFKVSYC